MKKLYTIGYTSYTRDDFLQALKNHKIDVIADVRSSPYSSYYKEYNQDILKKTLKENSILYVFLGKELGARPSDKSVYKEGIVDFSLVKNLSIFQEGISRLEKGLKDYNIALLCAEKDPIQCHRTILVSSGLHPKYSINHIWEKEKHEKNIFPVESHSELENRLIGEHFKNQLSLLYDREQMLEIAYKKQEKNIAYEENLEESGD